MRLLAAAATTLALSAALTACGGDDAEDFSSPSFNQTIGNLVPLRGDLATFGAAGKKAAELAAAEAQQGAEAAGGGIIVKLESADSETQALAATIAARKLVNEDGANCLNGDWSAASTLAVANQVAAKEKVPLISPASTNFAISILDDRGYVFRTAPSDSLQVVALANLVERELSGAGGKTVSLAARDDAYGKEFTRRFAAEWKKRGGSVRGPTLYDPTEASFDPEAKEIAAGKPDAFVIADFPQSYGKLAPALLEQSAFDAGKMFASDTLVVESASQWDIPEAALDGARATRPGSPAPSTTGKAFAQLFENSSVAPREPEAFSSQSFDATLLCFLARVAAAEFEGGTIAGQIRAVSGPPGEKLDFADLKRAVNLLRAGKEIDYEGASGPLDLDEQGDPTAASYDVLRYTGGKAKQDGRISASFGPAR